MRNFQDNFQTRKRIYLCFFSLYDRTFKISKSVHSISAFQKWRFVLPPRITIGRRLHVQAGYERCLFFSSTASLIKQLCAVFMVRESLWVSLFMLRLGTSYKNLHKFVKNTNLKLRRINIQIVINLDDMLIMSRTMEEIWDQRESFYILFINFIKSRTMGKSWESPVW